MKRRKKKKVTIVPYLWVSFKVTNYDGGPALQRAQLFDRVRWKVYRGHNDPLFCQLRWFESSYRLPLLINKNPIH